MARLAVAFAAFVALSTAAISAREGCNIVFANGRAIGSDPTKSIFVYGFDFSRADGKALDAKLVALGSDGTRLQEYAIHGALPALAAEKKEWTGLAFSVPANAVTSMILVADPAPDAGESTPCPAQKIDMKRVETSQAGSWPIGATDSGMLDLPASMVPAAGTLAPLDVRDAHCKVCAPVEYPMFAMFNEHVGRTDIGITIAADGTADGFTVLVSSGFTDLDNASLSSARSSSYVAATANGILVVSRVAVEYEFKIDR